jgi:hypothetical protein
MATFNSKVKRFFIMIIFVTFDELMLHHNVCSLSISEIQTWIKRSVEHTREAWRTKEVDWGPSTTVPHVFHLATTLVLAHGKKEIKSNTFWSWIRTAALGQLVMAATTSYGHGLGRSST